jgi:hypothetical protein
MANMTQLEKEKLAPQFWELIKVWKINQNDEKIPEMVSNLTKEENEYFQLMKRMVEMEIIIL